MSTQHLTTGVKALTLGRNPRERLEAALQQIEVASPKLETCYRAALEHLRLAPFQRDALTFQGVYVEHESTVISKLFKKPQDQHTEADFEALMLYCIVDIGEQIETARDNLNATKSLLRSTLQKTPRDPPSNTTELINVVNYNKGVAQIAAKTKEPLEKVVNALKAIQNAKSEDVRHMPELSTISTGAFSARYSQAFDAMITSTAEVHFRSQLKSLRALTRSECIDSALEALESVELALAQVQKVYEMSIST